MMASSYKRYTPVQKWKGTVKLQTKQDCCSVAANPPPKGISSRAIDESGRATRLVATQQPDKALHNTNLSRWKEITSIPASLADGMVVYCHVGAKHCHYCPLKCKNKRIAKLQAKQTVAVSPPIPPPKGISSRAMTFPGMPPDW